MINRIKEYGVIDGQNKGVEIINKKEKQEVLDEVSLKGYFKKEVIKSIWYLLKYDRLVDSDNKALGIEGIKGYVLLNEDKINLVVNELFDEYKEMIEPDYGYDYEKIYDYISSCLYEYDSWKVYPDILKKYLVFREELEI